MRERRIIENIIFFLYETIPDIGIPGTYFISSVSRVPPPIFTTTTVTPGAMTKGFTLHVFSSTRREKTDHILMETRTFLAHWVLETE